MNPVDVIGKKLDDNKTAAFLKSLGEEFEISSFADFTSLIFYTRGIAIRFDSENIISTIFLYPRYHHENYGNFNGELPCGLNFSDSRQIVQTKLGSPHAQSRFESADLWDRFSFDDYLLTVSYSKDSAYIYLITLFLLKLLP